MLRVMSHPGIARMIASFRFKTGAYLVLEYAPKGDLHSFIVKNGSLDESSARFVVGEVVAALDSIHNAGFIFGDLKPENIVLTAEGHAKITDFGAARPVSVAAIKHVQENKDAVHNLRDGDHAWRSARNKDKAAFEQKAAEKKEQSTGQSMGAGADADADADSAEEVKDTRIEGTACYLSPEVAKGGIPSAASDCWALGCLLYQCLAGRPPIWAENTQETMDAIVKFLPSEQTFPDRFPPHAKELVCSLLEPKMDARQNIDGVAAHAFFNSIDVYSLYSLPAPELVRGAAGPVPDAQWARRQQSMLWMPMPSDLSATTSVKVVSIAETTLEANAPFVKDMQHITES